MEAVKKPSFGSYFLVLIFPPDYFFSRKRIGAGIFSLMLLLISLPFFFVFGFGILIWLADAIWAAWNLRYELMHVQINEQAKAIARELASKKEGHDIKWIDLSGFNNSHIILGTVSRVENPLELGTTGGREHVD